MLQLHLKNTQGISVHDTNVPVDHINLIRFITLHKRGEGVGRGFKGRAPNRATIDMGDRLWRSVVLPDGYPLENLTEITISDSNHQVEPCFFKRSPSNPRKWEPTTHTSEGVDDNMGAGNSFAPKRTYMLEQALKVKFEYLGGVGVNDLGYLLVAQVRLPIDYETDKIKNNILDFCDEQRERLGVPIDVRFEVTGTTSVKPVVGEGHLGESPVMDHAMSGRHQIEPENLAPGGNNPIDAAALKPFSTGSQENILKPGQVDEPYGSVGPGDIEGIMAK